MSGYVVRDALVEDAPGIAHVHTRTWQVAYEHVFPTARLAGLVEEHRAAQWGEWLSSPEPRRHTLVVDVDGGIVGFAHVGPTRDPEASDELVGELYAIYVLPESWGRGIGRALMAEVLARLRSDGFREAVLWVIEDNPRTRRYYERAGWHFDGGIKEEPVLDIGVREVRYRIELVAAP
ncbi:MAG TPA: GNAT family N-acetyltransferase [Gaiellaceae bacterium]|nr:GNAT family N-acetyltransferase [Gaiellaceae bacterium]